MAADDRKPDCFDDMDALRAAGAGGAKRVEARTAKRARSQPTVRGPGILTIGDQAIAIRLHLALPVEVFGCPKCHRDCYILHFVDDEWRCRTCPPARSYACRHRKVPGLARIAFLRRRLHADPTPFSPLPAKRPGAWRHLALCREVRRLEAALLAHARDEVAAVLEKRYARRIDNERHEAVCDALAIGLSARAVARQFGMQEREVQAVWEEEARRCFDGEELRKHVALEDSRSQVFQQRDGAA